MKTSHTKEEKDNYFKQLRADWEKAKELSETDEIKGLMDELARMGLNPSANSIAFVNKQMKEKGLVGIPYIATKTYQKWQEAGFRVKKGERSIVKSITWIEKKSTEEGADGHTFPKATSLFHVSQVEPIKLSNEDEK